MKKAMKGWRTRILCALYWDVCRIGIACSVIWKVFTLNVFHITYNRCDQFMFAASNEVMVMQNILIFNMHRRRNLFLCCCDANWYFSFFIHWMKINLCWSQNCITFLQGFNAGSCKLCRNMRWIFGILGFTKFEMCCVYMSLSIQWCGYYFIASSIVHSRTRNGIAIWQKISINTAISTFWGPPGSRVSFLVTLFLVISSSASNFLLRSRRYFFGRFWLTFKSLSFYFNFSKFAGLLQFSFRHFLSFN